MEILLHWLRGNSGLAWVGSWIVGLTAVGIMIKKYAPKIRRFVKIGREGMDLIDTLLDAVQDEKITEEEIRKIVQEVNDFKEAIK